MRIAANVFEMLVETNVEESAIRSMFCQHLFNFKLKEI
jgi:hypothetical protein